MRQPQLSLPLSLNNIAGFIQLHSAFFPDRGGNRACNMPYRWVNLEGSLCEPFLYSKILLDSDFIRYFMWVLHDLHAVRLTSAKANTQQQTQQPVLMPVLNLDRVLLANSGAWFH